MTTPRPCLRRLARIAGGLCLLVYLVWSQRAPFDKAVARLRDLRLRVDEVGTVDGRLRPLRERLPRRMVLGWITDDAGPNVEKRHFRDQYALAPRVLDPLGAHELVLGDFVGDPRPVLASRGLHVVEDLGGGLLLLSR